MKKTGLISILIITCMIITMVGCTSKTGEPNMPEHANDISAQEILKIPVDSDYFLLCCENSDFTIDFSNSYSRDICYQLISAFPITSESDCSIVFDKAAEYTITISDVFETDVADEISLLTYSAKDWKKIGSDITQCTTKAEVDALLKEYGIDSPPKADDTVKLYSTYVVISFIDCSMDVELNALTMTVNGISKQYDIGSIKLINGTPNTANTALFINSVCLSDVPASICKEGFISVFDIEADINDEVVLSGVTLATQSVKLTDTLIHITKTDGSIVTRRFDQDTPIKLDKGDIIALDLTVEYSADNGCGIVNGQYFVIITFESNGKTERDLAEIIYRARFDAAFQYYISNELELDISSYWTEYLPALTGFSY